MGMGPGVGYELGQGGTGMTLAVEREHSVSDT